MKSVPKLITVEFTDGKKVVFPFGEAKPSKATGKPNAYAGGKHVAEDGTFQVGCNATFTAFGSSSK